MSPSVFFSEMADFKLRRAVHLAAKSITRRIVVGHYVNNNIKQADSIIEHL